MFKQKLLSYLKKYWLVYLIIVITLAIDLISKFIFNDVNKVLIKNVLSFTSTKNTGGAFSMLNNHTALLVVFSIIFLLFLVVVDKFYKSSSKLYLISYSLIISGAIGNLIDRVLFGYVRDFIRLDFMDFTNINTVFNFADICITIGVTLMLVYFICSLVWEKKQNDKKNN